MLKGMAYRAIEGYDALPLLYTEYTPSKLLANGVSAVGKQIFVGGEFHRIQGEEVKAVVYDGTLYQAGDRVTAIGSDYSSETYYTGGGGSFPKQGARNTLNYYAQSSSGTYGKYSQKQMVYWASSPGSAIARGASVRAIKYDGTLYTAGSPVTTIGTAHDSETLYRQNSTVVRACSDIVNYTASTAKEATLNKAALSTATATVLKL